MPDPLFDIRLRWREAVRTQIMDGAPPARRPTTPAGAGIGRRHRAREERESGIGVRSGKWLSFRHVCSAVRCAGPRWQRSAMGAVRADSRRRRPSPHARECAGAVGMVTESIAPAISGRASSRAFPVLGAAGRVGWYSHRPSAGEPFEPDAIDWSGMRALSEWPTTRQVTLR